MPPYRRWQLGFAGVAIGIGLAIASSALSAQTVAPAIPGFGWTQWLQVSVNLMKVIEMTVFIFSGYQFWAGRQERKAADIQAAEQARTDSIYQAWQVINSAQGKGGSGGRVEALGDLLRNGISLAGINLDGAWLEGAQLSRATLVRSSLQNTNLTHADLTGANLEGADLRQAILVTASLKGAILRGANLAGARLSAATLDDVDLTDVHGWPEVGSISYASIDNVRNAPAGFLEFARENGAVDSQSLGDAGDDETSYSKAFRIV